MSTPDRHEPTLVAGPVLYARGADGEGVRLGLVAVTREGAPAPRLEADGAEPVALALRAELFGHAVWGAEFSLPTGEDVGYRLDGRRFPVVTDLSGDVAVGFVSCNGQENGDEGRSHEDRDVMWRRLATEHRARPFALLLHGGDQLYADEAVEAHPETRRWAALSINEKPGVAFDAPMEEAVRGYFFRRYLALMRQPAFAELGARVPSLMIWDDHDIFDGWGSHPAGLQESPVALGLFRAAREMFMLFQLGADPAALPLTCRDRSGASFSQDARFPGFSVLLPDLRSERTPERVMGERGWEAFEAGLEAAPDGDRRIVVSSVPALGPRLSLVEALLDLYPGQQQYEDDLRDQWQSRGHRAEWARFLFAMEREAVTRGGPVTVVSGEIHLATRGEMRLSDGSSLHQLVASGITHPKPPAALGLGLGLLSRLGHSPLPGRPIRLKRLPGQARVYTAERNYLVLRRRAGHWTAAWELEESGRTAELGL
ncbi:alkaline phosphatase D family protein [Aureimonas sp. AU22]|uniref:alkaline phosphatase D family protein n=1 Tax=Aureimonas sp. AU22 TaxID=1638162 RepID=UPI000782A07B|nr:alkaline phosphatase D family protein [Aureimonas sp. AU22]